VLSVQFIREHVDRVRRDLALRNTTAPIDRILQLDDRRRALLQEVESLRHERNVASKHIGQTKDPAEREERIRAMREVGARIDALEAELREVERELREALLEVPNIVDPSVPPGPDESGNIVVEEWGQRRHFDFEPLPHWELGERLGGLDFERGVKMAGSRFFVMRGPLARLHRGLIAWMLDRHREAGFVEHYLPYMLTEASLYASGHLPKFRDNLYHDDQEDYFWVPTAEAPFVNLYRDEILPPGSLPKRLVAHTPCFRREQMSAGRDVRGIKRLHQFEKVELFVICEPHESDRELDGLVRRARALLEELELPHRVVQLCSGDLGFNAAKTFDIEVWAPGAGEWLEVSSASNCLDFQSRRANVRYRPEPEASVILPHMLNASGLALPRTLIAVMETYQNADGTITVPPPLRPYVGCDRIEPLA